MCGIAGIIGDRSGNTEALKRMLRKQQHRGPDATAIYSDHGVVLGHNRLSIIDLTDNAAQPMTSNCGRFTLVFNGEIYNYKELRSELEQSYQFQSASDSEVLLAAYVIWGAEALPKLNGMFSFAIWDSKAQQLFAVRDRFGVKPFYYTIQKSGFYFASEIKALHAAGIPALMDKKVWASYFVYGSYGMPDQTFWEQISQLPAGHYLTVANENVSVARWYDFEREVALQPVFESLEEIKKYYADLLSDSIRLRFRSDVPVGFNISGGLDSSVLLALVNRQFPDGSINAFTFCTGHSDYDETEFVDRMVAATGNHSEKVMLSVQEVPEFARKIARIQDEPFGGIPTLAYGKIFERARQQDTIVLLDGQGMDEQWAGYDYYLQNNNATIQGVSNSPFRPDVLSEDCRSLAEKPEFPGPFSDDLRNKQYRDLFFTKLPRALRFNDRVSMAYSTELREPFLDHRLVEFALSLPGHLKINGKNSKWLLREIARDYLPEAQVFDFKRPLQTPQREWLTVELRAWVTQLVEDILQSPLKDWFDREKMQNELNLYFAGDNQSGFHIWQYVSLGLLLKD